MANRIATVSGTALVPGVSKNGRLYSKEAIASAVQRAQARIAEGSQPLTMLSHHAAEDDSLRIIGRVTAMSVAEDGSAKFTADLADTDNARTIANLVSGDNPFLKGVSIRGAWVGQVERKVVDGQKVEYAPGGLELDGLDFTRKPGVEGAVIDDFQPVGGKPRESADGRTLIYESAEALVTFTEQVAEADAPKPVTPVPGGGPYADPGYQKDGKKRYPIDSKAHARAAWSYVNQKDNASAYTGPQLKRIKDRIKKALKKFGVTVAAESWLIDTIAEAVPAEQLAEMYGEPGGSFRLCATNGPLNIEISSYCVDPADLELILHAVVDSAVMALKNVDPDMDADMDVPGADSEDTDGDMDDGDGDSKPSLAQRLLAAALGSESAPDPGTVSETTQETTPESPAVTETAGNPETPAPEPAADQPVKEEPAMADTTTAVEQTPVAAPTTNAAPASVTLSNDQFQALLAAVAPKVPAPAESAPAAAAPVAEAAPAAPSAPAPAAQVAETTEQMMARLLAEQERKFEERLAAERTRAVQEAVENGGLPVRKGLVQPVNEHTAPTSQGAGGEIGLNDYGVPSDWPDKPLHKYTNEERQRYFGPAIERHALGSRASV